VGSDFQGWRSKQAESHEELASSWPKWPLLFGVQDHFSIALLARDALGPKELRSY
jgi:hypothetical protein